MSKTTRLPTKNTSQIIDICKDTLNKNADSYEELIRQNNTLERSNNELDHMKNRLGVAETSLNNIDSWWSRMYNYFTGSDTKTDAKINIENDKSTSPSNLGNLGNLNNSTNPNSQKSLIDQQDDELDEILGMVNNIKHQCLETNRVIDQSIQLTTNINHKTTQTDQKITQLIRLEKKIIG